MIRTIFFIFMLALILSLSAVAQTGANPKMSAEEKAKVIKLLKDSQQETLDAVAKLSEAQWAFKAAPEKWSIAETSEHILLAEGLLFAQVTKALAAAPNPEWETKTKGKTEFLEKVMPSRTGKAQAPEAIVPSGKLTKAEFLRKYKKVRAETLKFTEKCHQPLKAHTIEHPFPIFNTLNAYQWLIYIPLHNQRHNKQIEEVKTNAAFPAK